MIAATHHVSVESLVRANGITDPDHIRSGRYLRIPVGGALRYYHVRWGDTLLGIAGRFHVTLSEVRALNPRMGAYLLAGSWLRLCSGCAGTESTTAAQHASDPRPSGSRYVVQPGDTLSAIAQRFGVSAAALEAANQIRNPAVIIAGSRLFIPGASAAAGAVPPATNSIDPYDPSLARSLVVGWARFYGIAPSLPLAIAWQESGFNQGMISNTGAIGVMQVEPYTGRRISQLLGRPVNLYNLDDNIHGGVFWLTHLLNFYGWNVQLAVAAYYQGTRSLAVYGPYADTQQYVQNVLALQTQFGG
jgi:LysM repeat protein